MNRHLSIIKAATSDLAGGLARKERLDLSAVELLPCTIGGELKAIAGEDLVVQGVDAEGRFLANRGYKLYRFDGTSRFEYAQRLPSPIGPARLLGLPAVRRQLMKRDILQLYVSRAGTTILQSGGYLYRRAAASPQFQQVFKLRFWGRAGRGILYNGIEQTRSGRLLMGEYFNNAARVPVRIYASDDDGISWDVVHEFPRHAIRHVHAIHQDPFSDAVWVCTGDTDDESQILRSYDHGETFEVVGSGSQSWRTCTLLFDSECVCWGADTESYVDFRHLYRYHRVGGTVDRLTPTDGAIEFGLSPCPQLQIYATTRAGYGAVPDDVSKLIVRDTSGTIQTVDLAPRIKTNRGSAAGTKLYYSPTAELVCMSFTNLVGIDGAIAIVPIAEFLEFSKRS